MKLPLLINYNTFCRHLFTEFVQSFFLRPINIMNYYSLYNCQPRAYQESIHMIYYINFKMFQNNLVIIN